MIQLRNSYIDDRLRENLDVSKTHILTLDNIKRITGIYIGSSSDIDSGIVPVFWHLESSAYKMKTPNLFLSYDMFEHDDWEDDLRLFAHIKSFISTKQISVSLLNYFTKLTDLELSSIEVSDWSFLAGMTSLRNVVFSRCGNNGNQALRHLCHLYSTQLDIRTRKGTERKIDPFNHIIENVAIINMNVYDLSPLNYVKRFIELDLSRNAINDITPLSCVSINRLSLHNNVIENIDSLNLSESYEVDLMCNKIKTIKPIIDKLFIFGSERLSIKRIYLQGNNIPESEKQMLRSFDFVYTDLPSGRGNTMCHHRDDSSSDFDFSSEEYKQLVSSSLMFQYFEKSTEAFERHISSVHSSSIEPRSHDIWMDITCRYHLKAIEEYDKENEDDSCNE